MDMQTVVVVLVVGRWLWLEARSRAMMLEVRALLAEARANGEANGRHIAELRAVAAEAEVRRLHRVGAELRSVFIADVSPVLQRAHVQSDRLPGLLADVAGETHGVRDP